MNPEKAPGVEPKPNKIEISEDDKEVVGEELRFIGVVIDSLEKGDGEYAYADTGDSMETIDSMIGDEPAYKETLEGRKAASAKCMRGDEDEKREGRGEIRNWVGEVEGLL